MATGKKCIYLLEDNDDIRELIIFFLAEENYEVYGYSTIKTFNQVMKNGKPDMIVLDIMLTDGNGIDVYKSLKSDHKTNHIPILMMSANAHFYADKITSNAISFINKPFDIDDFVRRVNRFIN